jgi:Arc/MetJ-type ribon-helix-helix transcriptional regulator
MKEQLMTNISLYLPKRWIEALDNLVKEGYYSNRSEAIRMAIRDLLIKEAKI